LAGKAITTKATKVHEGKQKPIFPSIAQMGFAFLRGPSCPSWCMV
jgi:hypothetical protein